MAKIRIFLPTYRRPTLLRRALDSLRAQSETDWICEVHNDDPKDDTPAAIVAGLGDRRVVLHRHEHNWGAVATFRHAYAGGTEEYAAILEDDNWWEPAFLSANLQCLAAQPEAAMAWTNMRVWREEADGSWHDTGRHVWSHPAELGKPAVFAWPELYQSVDALHSHGAAVFRPRLFTDIPVSTPLALIEAIRERATTAPLLFIPEPLANFAVTRTTARNTDRSAWLQARLVLLVSFLLRHPPTATQIEHFWASRRQQVPADTAVLFFAALALRDCSLIKPAKSADWARFARGVVRHPGVALRGLRFRTAHSELWAWLQINPPTSKLPGYSPPRCMILGKASGLNMNRATVLPDSP